MYVFHSTILDEIFLILTCQFTLYRSVTGHEECLKAKGNYHVDFLRAGHQDHITKLVEGILTVVMYIKCKNSDFFFGKKVPPKILTSEFFVARTFYRPKTFCFTCNNNHNSTADTCKNCAECGKGFKIGTSEAYNIKIKIRLGGISKIFCFCSHANMAASDKGISLKKKFLKKFLLNVTN